MANPQLNESPQMRVVIVGGGFGGLYCARSLRKVPVQVTLIDRRNFHLFQPLLYQVATGGLSPANIAAPLRSIVAKQKNATTVLAEVVDIDTQAKEIVTADGKTVPYDVLVLATGSTHHYFGKDEEWAPFAPGLKSVEDATEIRARVLAAFERAEKQSDPEIQKKLLTFVVVGGGPTGVEMAGAIAELARVTLRNDFRRTDPNLANVILVEGLDVVLPQFHSRLSEYAKKALNQLGVEVITGMKVTDVAPDHVEIAGFNSDETRKIETPTVIWAAGVKASPLGKMLAEASDRVELDRAGRVIVEPDCTVAGHPEIFVIGDLANFKGKNGEPLPGVAPVAMQQGHYVAKLIRYRANGWEHPGPFRYLDKGSMATIGRSRAVADVYWFRFTGFIAWAAWLFIHILYLAKFSNRVLVIWQWFWSYATRNRSARLITGDLWHQEVRVSEGLSPRSRRQEEAHAEKQSAGSSQL